MNYERADFGPLARTQYGIGFHWTTATAAEEGEALPYEEAVNAFDVDAFVAQAVEAGAGHVLFTTTHSLHQLPGPNPEVDRILPGRTCERDLPMELADGLAAVGIPLMLYYNYGVHGNDPEWQEAVDADADDPAPYFERADRVVRWMGEHYGPKVIAWWVDHPRRERDDAQWWATTQAFKAGHPDRLVCHNSGVESHKLRTPYQDYWAGEVVRLNFLPRGELTPAGLPWYTFTSWHCGLRGHTAEWVLEPEDRALDWPVPPVEAVEPYVRRFLAVGGAVTFNLLCYQSGRAFGPDLEVMKALKARMGR